MCALVYMCTTWVVKKPVQVRRNAGSLEVELEMVVSHMLLLETEPNPLQKQQVSSTVKSALQPPKTLNFNTTL